MCKKIFSLIMLCLFFIPSVAFANSNSSDISLYLGNTTSLKAFIEKEKLDIPLNGQTHIQIADEKILTIDQYYNIKPLAVGQTTIVLVNGNKFETVLIRIESPIKEILVDENEIVLLKGEIYPFNYTVVKQDDYFKPVDQQLKWAVSKQNIASIKGDNKIYTISVGQMTLTGTTKDGSQSISINVTVLNNPNQLVIKPSVNNTSIKVGEIRQLKAFFGEKDVTSHVEWESEYPELLKIDENGYVTPLKAGTCVITAKSSVPTRQEDYTLFIKTMVDKITLNHSSIIFEDIGMSQQLKATLTYKNPNEIALLDGYYYESSNPNVATVDQNGVATAQGKGIALINAISNDSKKRASCTVEVIGDSSPTTIDFNAVREIHLDDYNTPILLGQKIPLTYEILPKDATDQTVKFSVRYGENDQIHFINNQYYFVPVEHGTVRIKIAANGDINDVEDEIEVSVVSPLASLDLELATQRGSNNERKLYIGEHSQVLTNIFTQGNYSIVDVYPNTLEYKVDDPDILKLDYINGQYTVTALKKGTTSIRVHDIEGRHNDSLKVRVISPISKMATDREVKIPLDINYTPRISYTSVTSAQDLPQFNLSRTIHLDVEEFYFNETYIDAEITYEKQLIDIFTQSPVAPTSQATIERHQLRLDRLLLLKKSATSGYCKVTNNFLKDRNFESYRYYTIDESKISGHYPGKAKITVSINGTGASAKTLIHFQNKDDDFAIKKHAQWIDYDTLLEENGLNNVLSTLDVKEQVKYYIHYLINIDKFKTLPTLELLKASLALENSKLPHYLRIPTNEAVTKQDLAYIAQYLDLDLSLIDTLATKNIVYYDVINEEVKQTLTKMYLSADSDNYFGVNTPVSYDMFKQLVDQIIPINNLPQTIDQSFTREQLILLLNQI